MRIGFFFLLEDRKTLTNNNKNAIKKKKKQMKVFKMILKYNKNTRNPSQHFHALFLILLYLYSKRYMFMEK